MATDVRVPTGLAARGRRLWREVRETAELDPAQLVILEEACRIADRLDRLDAALRGKADVFALAESEDGTPVRLVVDGALSEARQQANVLKQLLVTLRLPDEATGKRPQRRGARGAYSSSGKLSGSVSSLDRARARSSGA